MTRSTRGRASARARTPHCLSHLASPWPLAPLAAACLPFCALAQVAPAPAASPAAPLTLEPLTVTADPLRRALPSFTTPVDLLAGDELRQREAGTLGATLDGLPGVHSTAYGPGAGRPIVRGMDGPRVGVTEGGLGTGDVSSLSPDHRVTADTFNATQVEIFRGPAALLYGAGAIGGLVNVVHERVPQRPLSQFAGHLDLRGATADRGAGVGAGLDLPLGSSAAARFEGFSQRSGDYRLAAPLRDDTGAVLAEDRLPNSDTRARSAALGAAWFGPSGWRLGAAVLRDDSRYGIPNPGEPVTIDLERERLELELDTAAAGPFETLRLRVASTDYLHRELEPDGTAGARFDRDTREGRVELPLAPLGALRVVLGAHVIDATTRGAGEGELPETRASTAAVFVVGELPLGPVRLDAGLRGERVEYDVRASYEDGTRPAARSFRPLSASIGASWIPAAGWRLGASLSSSRRAPAVEELYFRGAHPATFAFEIGDPGLRRERATQVEFVAEAHQGPWRAQLNVYRASIADHVFSRFDGSTTDVIEDGVVVETLSNLVVRQDDARYQGGEFQLRYGHPLGFQAALRADRVRAQLRSGPDAGADLPRIAPDRIALDLGWKATRWDGRLSLLRVARQDRTAGFDLRDGEPESATEGYTRIDAEAGWSPEIGARDLRVYLRGTNLGDREIRIHTSYLKALAPAPGRSLLLGMRLRF